MLKVVSIETLMTQTIKRNMIEKYVETEGHVDLILVDEIPSNGVSVYTFEDMRTRERYTLTFRQQEENKGNFEITLSKV